MTTGDDLDIPDSFEQAQEAGDATHGAGGDRHGRDLDLPVGREAARTLAFAGQRYREYTDVGVR